MRTVRQNRAKIRRLREQGGLTQEGLARIIGCDVKNISRAETCPRVALTTLTRIAAALGMSVMDLQIPDVLGGDDPSPWLRKAIAHDDAGNVADAIDIGTAIVDQLSEDHHVYVDAVVRLATFHDHAGSYEIALQVLDRLELELHTPPDGESTPPTTAGGPRIWGYYQRGLISRRLAEDLLERTQRQRRPAIEQLMRRAETDLTYVRRYGDDPQRHAALHQLGVLHTLNGEYEDAVRAFTECIRWRQEQPGVADGKADEHRLGYELRRRAQAHAFLGELDQAKADWQKAIEIASGTGHTRLRRETERDSRAWAETASDPSEGQPRTR